MVSRQLPNSLTVFAAALELEYGQCRYRHFGFYGAEGLDDLDLPDAQQQLAELVGSLEQAAGPGKARVLHQTVQHLDLLWTLQDARTRLEPDGQLIWCGEFVLDNGETGREPVPRLATFQRLVQRLGFTILQQRSLTRSVQPTWSALLELLQRHAAALKQQFSLDDIQLEELRSRLQQGGERFERGRQGFFIHVLGLQPDRDGSRAVEYGDIHSFDEAQVNLLFEQSFGHAFNPALWRWKYGNGRGRAVVARKDGRVVAHYGGAPRNVCYFGRPDLAIQICDVMVLPEERRHYGQESLFFKTAATFLEREIGYTVDHLLGFGFPNLKAMHIATRLGLYEKTDEFMELFYPRDYVPPAGDWQLQAMDAQPGSVQWQDRLWQAMAEDLVSGIVGVRDPAWLRYRYLDHPSGAYRLHWVLAPGQDTPMALVVLKKFQQSYLLMDIVGAIDNMKPAMTAVINAYRQQDDHDGIRCWITRGWLEALSLSGAVVTDLSIEIPCHSWSPGPPANLLYGKWWLMAGDMDFQ